MEVKKWDVKEQFLFPASFGIPKDIKTVQVTPQFEKNETKESIQIVGIYHITCHVEFKEGEHAHHATSEFTQIEDLDVQGEVGYFEYAVPMSVEISKDKIKQGNSPTLKVQHVKSKTTNHASIEIAWSVLCEYEAPVEKKEEKIEEIKVEKVVEKKLEMVIEKKIEKAVEKKTVKKAPKEVELVESSNLVNSELQFILELDDGMSKLSFPSNYVSVKQKEEQ